MAYRQRTSKVIAQRHDLNHFKYTPGLRRWQGYLTLAALLLAVGAALAFTARRGGGALFSAGPMSSSHALLANNCAACHSSAMQGAGATLARVGFRRRVQDSACIACHVAPAHLAGTAVQAAFTPQCGSCHVEHVGSTHLSQTSDQNCTQCHASLRSVAGSVTVAQQIRSFGDGHPEFAAVRDGQTNSEHILFNHAAHLQTGLAGPDGRGRVQMTCGDCHKSFAAVAAGGAFRFAASDPSPNDEAPSPRESPWGKRAPSGREYMAPVAFQASCRACHNLQFDFFTRAEAPHASAAVVSAFVRAQIQTCAAQHPEAVASDIRQLALTRPTPVPGHPDQPLALPKNSSEWIEWRVAYSEQVLRKKCELCHEASATADAAGIPALLPTHQPVRRFENSLFSHGAHEAFACESCHLKARSSVEPADVLLPGIATCRKCHNGRPEAQSAAVGAGHAQSGCFLCHEYHRWSAWHGEEPKHVASVEDLRASK